MVLDNKRTQTRTPRFKFVQKHLLGAIILSRFSEQVAASPTPRANVGRLFFSFLFLLSVVYP